MKILIAAPGTMGAGAFIGFPSALLATISGFSVFSPCGREKAKDRRTLQQVLDLPLQPGHNTASGDCDSCGGRRSWARSVSSRKQRTGRIAGGLEPFKQELAKRGESIANFDRQVTRIIRELWTLSGSVPLDMIGEKMLREQINRLRPAQFVSLNLQLMNGQVQQQHKKNKKPEWCMPYLVASACRTLRAAYALFVDELFGGLTNHFSTFDRASERKKAERLFGIFRAHFSTLKPGGPYGLVDSFAKEIGFPDLHTWTSKALYEIPSDDLEN